MKNRNILILIGLLLVGSAILFLVGNAMAQVITNVPPSLREFVINTNPSNLSAATSLHFIPGKFVIDPVHFKPLISGNIEFWAAETDNGVTNNIIIRSQNITLTTVQLTSWLNAADGKAYLEGVILSKTRLSRKP